MSRWHDQFSEHPFFSTWEEIRKTLESEEFENSERSPQEFGRLKKVVEYIDAAMEEMDPELVPTPILQPMQNYAEKVLNELNAFLGDENPGHVQNANNSLDQVLIQITNTPFLYTGARKQALTNAAKAYNDAIEASLESVKTKSSNAIEETRAEAKELSDELVRLKSTLENLTTQMSALKKDQESVLAKLNSEFQASEKQRDEQFEKLLDKANEKMDSRFEELATKSGKIVDVLMTLQSHAQKVYDVVIGTAQAGAYSSYATQERKIANRYRFSAVTLMLIAAALLAVPEVYKIIEGGADYVLDWKAVLGRFPLSLIILVPAFYLARESNRHRDNELVNKRRELILSTIDPYLALLKDEDEKDRIKGEIATSIFSDKISDSRSEDTSNVLAQLSNLIDRFRK